jgi:hypothetical protein
MTVTEIFTRTTSAREELDQLLSDMSTFTLNPRVAELEKEIYNLQQQCPHEYEKGICKHCGKEEQ